MLNDLACLLRYIVSFEGLPESSVSLMFAAEEWTTTADGTAALSVSLTVNVKYAPTCSTPRYGMLGHVRHPGWPACGRGRQGELPWGRRCTAGVPGQARGTIRVPFTPELHTHIPQT